MNTITTSCKYCNRRIEKPKSEVKKSSTGNFFCNNTCAAKYNNKRRSSQLRRKCKYCSSIVRSTTSRLCEKHYQDYKFGHLNRTLAYYMEKRSGGHMAAVYADVRGIGRSMHTNLLSLPCASCGYEKHVELCHKKPISEFDRTATVAEINSKDNVVQLCPNCHWEFDNGLLDL